MKKLVAIGLAIVLLLALGVGGVSAAGHPSAKATAAVDDIIVVGDEFAWGPTLVLSNTIKTANQKDLFIDVSLQCGLYTRTLVKSKGKTEDSATAEAGVQVMVEVDGHTVKPGGWITFAEREQKLTAWLAGYDPNGVLQTEDIELALKTMSAHSFNFIVENLDSGVHTVKVWAQIVCTESTGGSKQGEAEALGTIGAGSVTIEEVRMIKNEVIEM